MGKIGDCNNFDQQIDLKESETLNCISNRRTLLVLEWFDFQGWRESFIFHYLIVH